MVTRRFAIRESIREHPIRIVSPTDFDCVPDCDIEAQEVFLDPKYSLYCFDPENCAAIFVESRDPVAVDKAPFYYQGQVQTAIGLVSMPLEVFHRVAEEIPEPPKGLIFIHSVGRCGSTLLSKALQGVPCVHSLSEPDDLTQIGNLRGSGDYADEWIGVLIKSSTKWRCKPRLGPPADYVAIKTRSEVLILGDLIGASFSHSKHLFLYRNGLSWMGTIFRGFPLDRDVYDAESNRKWEDSWSRTLPIIREYRSEDAPMNMVQVRMLGWITCMEGCLKLMETGIEVCPARYEDLVSNPIPILEQIFSFCGIEGVDWTVIRDVLSRDSQAGTIYDREERKKLCRELTPELVKDLYDIVATRPLLLTPDVVLSGTVGSQSS